MEYQFHTTNGRGKSIKVYSMSGNFYGSVRELTAYDNQKCKIGDFPSHDAALQAVAKWGYDHISRT